MNQKKLYIYQLADFLHSHSMTMSGEELAEHLNRNGFLTEYGTEYQGGRGTYGLIKEVWSWLHHELQAEQAAAKVARAFVKPDGGYAYADGRS